MQLVGWGTLGARAFFSYNRCEGRKSECSKSKQKLFFSFSGILIIVRPRNFQRLIFSVRASFCQVLWPGNKVEFYF